MRVLLWIYILIGCAITTVKAFALSTSEDFRKGPRHPVVMIVTVCIMFLNVFIWPFNTTFEIKNVKK